MLRVLSSRLLWGSHSVDVAGAVGTFERTEMTRVLIISEVRLYREGLVRLLRRERRLDVVGTACDVPEALDVLAGLPVPPEAVLLDVPATRGVEAMRRLEPWLPAARIVALNVSDADETAVIAWAEAGVSGLLARDADVKEVAQAVATTAGGGTVCSPRLAALLLKGVAATAGERPAAAPLTSREREIAELLEEGLSNKEIAARLAIELPTVKNHVHSILTKLNASRRGQAAAMLRGVH
jgi:two-component system, NarL family, nitrate/nitrite response regulator NarL